MTALSGVRNSWLMFARNMDLALIRRLRAFGGDGELGGAFVDALHSKSSAACFRRAGAICISSPKLLAPERAAITMALAPKSAAMIASA